AAPVMRRQLAIGPPAPWRLPARRQPLTSHAPPLPAACAKAALCYSQVASGQPAAEPRGDLIGNRAQRARPVLRGALPGVAAAEQQHLVTFHRGLGTEVHDELV